MGFLAVEVVASKSGRMVPSGREIILFNRNLTCMSHPSTMGRASLADHDALAAASESDTTIGGLLLVVAIILADIEYSHVLSEVDVRCVRRDEYSHGFLIVLILGLAAVPQRSRAKANRQLRSFIHNFGKGYFLGWLAGAHRASKRTKRCGVENVRVVFSFVASRLTVFFPHPSSGLQFT